MREVTEKFNVYSFKEASKELKEKIRDNIAQNWDLYDHHMNERIETLKKVAELLNAKLDYSISCVPDRGEYIKMTPIYSEFTFQEFWDAIDVDEACPLTGVCYDHDIIDCFTLHNLNSNTLKDSFNNFLKSIHDEYESMLQDDYLTDLCEANDYEFKEDGKLY